MGLSGLFMGLSGLFMGLKQLFVYGTSSSVGHGTVCSWDSLR